MQARSPVLARVEPRERRYDRGRARRRRDLFALALALLLTVGCGIAVRAAAPFTVGFFSGGGRAEARVGAGVAKTAPTLGAVAGVQPAPAHLEGVVPAFDLGSLTAGAEPALALHAKSALLVDLDTSRALWQKDPHLRRAPASLTKLMTAVVALDLVGPDATVTVTAEAAAAEPSRMGVAAGQTFTVRELLYGALLNSGNDAAFALADGIVPFDRFLYLMNAKAVQLRMRDTHFSTPNGLTDAENYTSSYDLAVLATYVVHEYPEIVRIGALKDAYLPATAGHPAFYPHNLNHFLDVYAGATGLKTGFTDDAGGCLIATATRGGRHLLLVLMGSDIMFGDGARLMDHGFATQP